jgi:4-amino-4-deoxy-L-arabinose transferase-like glycosyltransferase
MMKNPAIEAGQAKTWWRLYWVAALTFLPTLFFYYVGEEAIFPVSALEMWHQGEWLQRLLFGGDLEHMPLYTWLIMPLAAFVGWEFLLPVTRAITVSATVISGLVTAQLVMRLYGDRFLAAFSAVIFITLSDLFLYRGWLAYVDPLFSLFVFLAIATLWLACERRDSWYLFGAVLSLSAAFLSKALTAYTFYAGAALVLLFRAEYRPFLLSWRSLIMHLAAFALPLVWFAAIAPARSQGNRMFAEITAKLAPEHLGGYLAKLVLYPLEFALACAPVLFVALWHTVRNRQWPVAADDRHTRTALGILGLNFLPYWLAPHSHIRYLLPLFPLAALLLARGLLALGTPAQTSARRWIQGLIVVKLLLVLLAFPWYQQHYRGANYREAAMDILQRTAGFPLHTLNVSASGLSVAAYLDVARLPDDPVRFPPQDWTDGFLMTYDDLPAHGRRVETYRLGGNELLLFCRGRACVGAQSGGLLK